MELHVENLGPQLRLLHIEGRLDATAVEQVRQTWSNEDSSQYVVIDLSQTSFIDSLGLATLVAGLKTVRQHGGELVLLNPSEPVKVILDLTRMNIVFKIAPTIEEAKIHCHRP